MVLYEDGSLYESREETNAHEDLVALPYSSGTTGPPKGVSLTHYNMVANMAQLNHPEVTMLRETNDDLQECTVAVLPFFHIYAMNTIMTLGLQIGAKIVTVPRFEPEMYLKCLVQYRVSLISFLDVAKQIAFVRGLKIKIEIIQYFFIERPRVKKIL